MGAPSVLLALVTGLVAAVGLNFQSASTAEDVITADNEADETEADVYEQFQTIDHAYRTIRGNPKNRGLSDDEFRTMMRTSLNPATGRPSNASKVIALRNLGSVVEFRRLLSGDMSSAPPRAHVPKPDDTAADEDAPLDALPKVLFIIPLGTNNSRVFMKNVKSLPRGCCHFMVFPYTAASHGMWHSETIAKNLSALGPPGSMSISVMGTTSGRKHEFVAQAVRDLGHDLLKYDWVLTVDDDIDFSHMDFKRFLKVANDTQAAIVAPAMKYSRYWPTYMQPHGEAASNPHSDCKHSLFRYSNFVELQMPMFRPRALRVVTSKLSFPLINNRSASDWGMDNVWCNLVAHELNMSSTKTCAIVDVEHAIHFDSRANGVGDASECSNTTLPGVSQALHLQELYPRFYVDRVDVRTFSCCGAGGCGRPHLPKFSHRRGHKAARLNQEPHHLILDAYGAVHRCDLDNHTMARFVLGNRSRKHAANSTRSAKS